MAVAIRGTTPGVTSTTADPISLTLNGARQPNTNDILVIVHGNDFYTLANMTTPTVGGSSTGVTAVTTADGGTDNAHVKAWWFKATSTADLTVAVDETGAADEEKVLVVYVLSGADGTTPIDAAGGNAGTTSVSHVAPSVSPATSDAYLICHSNSGGGSASNVPHTSPGGMSEQYDTATGGIGYVGAIEQLVASGATGTKTFTASNPTSFAAVSIAVRTATAAVTGPPIFQRRRSRGLVLRP